VSTRGARNQTVGSPPAIRRRAPLGAPASGSSYNGPIPFSSTQWESAAYRTAGSTSYGLNVIACCMAS